MKKVFPLGLAVIATGSMLATAAFSQGGMQTTWSGIYTDEQAQRGSAGYAQHCAMCHGATLAGTGEATGLSGPVFLSSWDGLSVGALLDRIRTTMPFHAPGSLKSQENADILAFILQQNGFPAGQMEVPRRPEMLGEVFIQTQRPSGMSSQLSEPESEAVSVAPAQVQPAATTQRTAAAERPPLVPAPLYAPPTGSNAPNAQPNPYRRDLTFFKLPAGRTMGSTSGVAIDSKGNIWVADRCGANNCGDSSLDPIMMFDASGTFVRAFGGGMTVFPHGFFIDHQDNVWVTDAQSRDGKGARVLKFSPEGELLLALGKAGVSQSGQDTFVSPCSVVVAKDGTIFVADGHNPGEQARVVMFAPDGRYIGEWGSTGHGPSDIEVPHAIAMDSNQRVFVGDRWNNRVQVFSRGGEHLGSFYQFGRPSGIFIDTDDTMYVADSESRDGSNYGYNPGWQRGIRIGSAITGKVEYFIPDLDPDQDASATSGAEGVWVDKNGVIFAAQVKEGVVARYVK